jgi:hypothetical protein
MYICILYVHMYFVNLYVCQFQENPKSIGGALGVVYVRFEGSTLTRRCLRVNSASVKDSSHDTSRGKAKLGQRSFSGLHASPEKP